MKDLELLIAGFGGQGVLFAGKMAAYAGLLDGKEISWMPSYGPEMRGGTANCNVCVSDKPIGSPLVVNPTGFIVMNNPSLDKFINDVKPGCVVVIDSTIVDKKVERTDVEVYYVPATELAEKNDLKGLANIILLGKLLKATGFASDEAVDGAIKKCVSAKKQHLLEANKKAIKLGMDA